MRVPGELWRRLLFLFRRRPFHRDLAEEMRFHLEMETRAEACAGARRRFWQRHAVAGS